MHNFIKVSNKLAEVTSITTSNGLNITAELLNNREKVSLVNGSPLNTPELSDILLMLSEIQSSEFLCNKALRDTLTRSGDFDIANLDFYDSLGNQSLIKPHLSDFGTSKDALNLPRLYYPFTSGQSKADSIMILLRVTFNETTNKFTIGVVHDDPENYYSERDLSAINIQANIIDRCIRTLAESSGITSPYTIITPNYEILC